MFCLPIPNYRPSLLQANLPFKGIRLSSVWAHSSPLVKAGPKVHFCQLWTDGWMDFYNHSGQSRQFIARLHVISHSTHARTASLQWEPCIRWAWTQPKISSLYYFFSLFKLQLPSFSFHHLPPSHPISLLSLEEWGCSALIPLRPLFDFELMYTKLKLAKTGSRISEHHLSWYLSNCRVAEHASSLLDMFDV